MGFQNKSGTHLEGYDSDGHHAEPNHGESVFASEETRVKVTDAGDHEPDESGGGEDPSDVAEVVDDIRLRVWVVPDKRPS